MSFLVQAARLDSRFIEVPPSIVTWSRVEVDPTSPDLAHGLKAQIADPLWAIHRQRAVGELDGSDAGTPVEVNLRGDIGRLSRFRAGGSGSDVDYVQSSAPLEVLVEHEPALSIHPRMAATLGQRFLRRLRLENGSQFAARFVKAFPLVIELPTDVAADQRGLAWATLTKDRSLDGAKLRDALADLVDAAGVITEIPDAVSIPQAGRARVIRSLNAWHQQLKQTLSEPESSDGSSWIPSRLEYAFAASAQMSDGSVTLRSDEYTDGRLDWYSFDAAGTPNLGDPVSAVPAESLELGPMLPSVVSYPGMPADRFWEFEDRQVNFGDITAGPTDLSRMLLVEFGLVFGNDWFLVPVDLPVGSLFSISDLTVTDTFGVVTSIGPSRNTGGSTDWEMFELAVTGQRLRRLQNLFFLPPVVATRFESEPLEEVNLMRDEMANLAWGVERKVMGVAGEAVNRALAVGRNPVVRQQLDADITDAEIVYRLASAVPEHWIPFAPVATGPITDTNFDVALERRTLLRTHADGSTTEVHPHGQLLRNDTTKSVETEAPLRIESAEVPRSGAIVTRSIQLARWLDGSRRIWIGRAKRTGSGEGASNLRFDQPEPR